ncbi:hypothetical protein FQZ97_820760 [compost metagenome]
MVQRWGNRQMAVGGFKMAVGGQSNKIGSFEIMRSALFLFLCTLCSLVRADAQTVQYLHEVSTRSFLFCSSAMAYFNPQDQMPDPRSLAASFDNLNNLETRMVQLGQPPQLLEPLNGMRAIFKQLDSGTRSSLYPDKIRQLLELNQQMQAAVAKAYEADLKTTPSSMELLNEQSQSIASLLMDYQLRRYPLADEAGFGIDQNRLQSISEAIDGRFSLLMEKYPDRVAILDKVRKHYQFVRSQLLQVKGRQNGGAEFYITRSVIDLNELAMELALTPPAS